MKELKAVTVCLVSTLLMGCVGTSDYKKNMADLTHRNGQYLRSLGYHIVRSDSRSGFIEAYKSKGGSSPNDLKVFYPNQQINPYRAVNTSSGNQAISSITAYWLPGKDQLSRREQEIAEANTSRQPSQSSITPSYTPTIEPLPSSSSQESDSFTKLEHKTL